MDKKVIRTAIDAILLLRVAQNQGNGLSNNVIQPTDSGLNVVDQDSQFDKILNDPAATMTLGSGDSFFKGKMNSSQLFTMSGYPDPQKIEQTIGNTLSNMGFNKNAQYSPQDIQRFSAAIKTALNSLCGNFTQYINPEFFQ